MRTKIFRYLIVLSGFVAFCSYDARSQTNQNSTMVKVDLSSQSRGSIEAAILKELREINDAADRHDLAAVLAHFADGEMMFYDPQSGRLDTEGIKNGWREAIEVSAKRNEKVVDEITKPYILPLGADTALANYVNINKTTVDGKTTILRFGETDIFVLQNGRWLLRATHSVLLREKSTRSSPECRSTGSAHATATQITIR
jgi:hypothetical protein